MSDRFNFEFHYNSHIGYVPEYYNLQCESNDYKSFDDWINYLCLLEGNIGEWLSYIKIYGRSIDEPCASIYLRNHCPDPQLFDSLIAHISQKSFVNYIARDWQVIDRLRSFNKFNSCEHTVSYDIHPELWYYNTVAYIDMGKGNSLPKGADIPHTTCPWLRTIGNSPRDFQFNIVGNKMHIGFAKPDDRELFMCTVGGKFDPD